MIPHVFSPVRPQDYTITPITVHKQYVIQRSDLYNGSTPITSSGYKILEARHTNEKLKLGTDRTYPTNSFDESNQHIVWSQLDAMYYRFPNDPFATLEHSNHRYIYKNLDISASIIQIPQHDFGEGIKPGSVQLTSSYFGELYYFGDDGNGNLYRTRYNTYNFNNSYMSGSSYLLYNWKCEDYSYDTKFKYITSDNSYRIIENESIIKYVDIHTRSYPLTTYFKNVLALESAKLVSGPISKYRAYYFPPNVNSYIRTEHQNDLNLLGDFTIMFVFRCAADISDFTFIDKSKIKTKISNISSYSIVDGVKYSNETTSSVIYEPTNVFPYQFSVDSAGRMVYSRSNGITIKTMSPIMSVNNFDDYSRYIVTKLGNTIYFYVNGVLEGQMDDFNENIANLHDVMFGSPNLTETIPSQGTNDFDINGYHLGNICLFSRGFTGDEITNMGEFDEFTFTHAVGNIFYKSGKIVATAFQSPDVLLSDFTLKYRNTHTIYQYETLCRIKPGDFNLSQNPTTRQTPYSDLLINEMTSSVADGGMPVYATTVGLYNDSGELLVIGKLGQALKMREDVPINLIIRFDT